MENAFVDIHTHISTTPMATEPVRVLHSYGIHPWWFDDPHDPDFTTQQLRYLERLLQEHRLTAIGETGIDKLHPNTLEQQLHAFEQQIKLSEENHKPLIIHNVKGTPEILQIQKKLHPKQLWIIHGFNGNQEEVRQLVGHGICLSLGESLFHENRKIVASIKSIPLDHLFLETDTSGYRIEEVYLRAAELLEIPLEDLKAHLFETFMRRFEPSFETPDSFTFCASFDTTNTASPKVLLTAPVLGSLMDKGNSNESER